MGAQPLEQKCDVKIIAPITSDTVGYFLKREKFAGQRMNYIFAQGIPVSDCRDNDLEIRNSCKSLADAENDLNKKYLSAIKLANSENLKATEKYLLGCSGEINKKGIDGFVAVRETLVKIHLMLRNGIIRSPIDAEKIVLMPQEERFAGVKKYFDNLSVEDRTGINNQLESINSFAPEPGK